MLFEQINPAELRHVVALQYSGSGAPILSAKGSAETAEQILRIAAEHDIPLCENPALVDLLSQLELGEEVPEELYTAVAYVLAFAYDVVFGQEDSDKTHTATDQ